MAVIDAHTLEAAIAQHLDDLIGIRHDIHRHPELSNREFRTAAVVAEALQGLGLEIRQQVAHTGVVALLRGAHPGPVIALRADMDALPIEEQTGLPYASTVRAQYNGHEVPVMHACGHDLHTTALIGTARILAAWREHLHGSVKFIFQPAEEGAPEGEQGGAALMIEQGVLEDPRPEAIFAWHVSTQALGRITLRKGPSMAGGSTFQVRIKGKQSHAAAPWRGIDPVVVSAQVILAWQTLVSRQSDFSSLPPPVLSVGRVIGNGRTNIIPEHVDLEGTLRIFSEEQRRNLVEAFRRTTLGIVQAAGAEAEISVRDLYPPLYNDPALVERVLPSLQRASGNALEIATGLVYGNEDFAFYSQQIPGVFFSIGATPEHLDPQQASGIHTPTFQASDHTLEHALRSLLQLSLDYLTDAAAS